MRQIEILHLAIGALERLGINYVVVGSYASSAWGEPRMTIDVDIVIQIAPSEVESLCNAFPEQDFYLSRAAALEAVQQRSQFNVIHPSTGHKIDFMVPGTGDWPSSQLARRRRIEFEPGISGFVAAPEDVILGKLIYFREGGSEKHRRDIRGIIKVSGGQLDRDYLRSGVAQLGVDDAWKEIVSEDTDDGSR